MGNGLEKHRRAIVADLLSDVQRFARHRFASAVLAQALSMASDEDAAALAHKLFQQPGAIADLSCHNFGAQVAKGLLELPSFRQEVLSQISESGNKVLRKKYGRMM